MGALGSEGSHSATETRPDCPDSSLILGLILGATATAPALPALSRHHPQPLQSLAQPECADQLAEE